MKIWVYFILFFSLLSNAQELVSLPSVPLKADTFVGIDNYNSIYYVEDNVLYKKADKLYNFTDVQLGNITRVDIINPLKIVLYYEDFNTVIFLDNRLNEMKRINFNDAGLFINMGGLTNAGNNRLWIFNIDSQQLELLQYNTFQKREIATPIFDTYYNQVSDFNYCIVQTQDQGYIYNIYGSLLKTLTLPPDAKLSLHNQEIVMVTTAEIVVSTIEEDNELRISMPEISIKDLYYRGRTLYIYDGKILHTFALTQP